MYLLYSFTIIIKSALCSLATYSRSYLRRTIREIRSTKRYVNLIETLRVKACDFDDITLTFSRIYTASVARGYPERQAQLVVEDIPTLPTEL